jgi:uncharacterized protein YutE (UPF0331/DUF86 family)
LVDREILGKRLAYLEELETDLEGFASVPEAEFVRNRAVHHLAERYLHLAVECMIDVANHLLAQRSLAVPDTYKEAFDLLAREGIITDALATRLRGWAGFRNVLVHLYIDIDHGISWRVIQNERGDLTAFRRAVAALM